MLAVNAAALTVIALTASRESVTTRDVTIFLVLAGLSVVHLESARGVERMRELATEGRPYVDLKSIWTFAGLLVLPPPLVAVLIVITYTHSWLRVGRHIQLFRWVFSAGMVVLGTAAAGVILEAGDFAEVDPAAGWPGLLVVVLAAVARWAVNSVLLFVAMPLVSPTTTWGQAWRSVFGSPADDQEEFTALSLGAVVAILLSDGAPWLVMLALPLFLMHRGLQLRKIESAARFDPETSTLTAVVWRELADKQLQRAARLESSVGYLLVRVDGHDDLISERGTESASRVLRSVADGARAVLRERDLIGRLPGAEFVVLLVDVHTTDELQRVAHRLKNSVTAATNATSGAHRRLTVSIGGALFPAHASSLTDLVQRADGALWLARAYHSGQIRIVGTGPQVPQPRDNTELSSGSEHRPGGVPDERHR